MSTEHRAQFSHEHLEKCKPKIYFIYNIYIIYKVFNNSSNHPHNCTLSTNKLCSVLCALFANI